MTQPLRSKPMYKPSMGTARSVESTPLRLNVDWDHLLEIAEGSKPKHGTKKGRRSGFRTKLPPAILALQKRRAALRAKSQGQHEAAKVTLAPSISGEAFEPSARARVILNGVRIAEEDLRAAGGAYTLEQVQALMHGVTRQAVEKRVNEGSLLAVPGPSNRRRYPVAQFNPDGSIVGGMRSIREVLPTKNPWTLLNFLVQPDPKLGGKKPIELMRRGEVDLVVEAAKRIGEQGA